MKKIILTLIASVVITLNVFTQSAGDYRSVASGNWNDVTKWETYNGSNWISATSYPGQHAGTGAITIMNGTEIKITEAVSYPLASLNINVDLDGILQPGMLTFSSENAVSLIVSGSIGIYGELRIDNQSGTKTHTLSIGGGLEVGTKLIDPESNCPPYGFIPATFQTINQDDKLSVVFNSAAYSWIDSGPQWIEFQDITFNAAGFTVVSPINIRGNATFITGIVTTLSDGCCGHQQDCFRAYSNNGSVFFYDSATVSGASNASYVDGTVTKWGHDAFTFPIGNGHVYAPLTISAPAGQDVTASARYLRSNASD